MAPGAMIEGSKVEEGEKCGLDMSSYEDLPPPSVGGDCNNGDGKDDYVFVNGSDAASDDHGNGGPNASELDVYSHEEVGGVNDGIVDGDTVLDDPGEQGDNGELNSSELRVDISEKSEGGNVKNDTCDKLDVDNGNGDEVDNEIKVVGEALEVGEGVNGEKENGGKVEGGGLVKENGEVNLKSEVVGEDGQSRIENGHVNDMENFGVKVHDSDLVEESHGNLVPDGNEDGESCVQKADDCNLSVDRMTTLVSDDDKVRIPLFVDEGSDVKSSDMDEAQNGIVEDTPLVSESFSEHQHLMESRRDEDEGTLPLVEDDVVPHADEVKDREMEPYVKDLKPSACDVGCQSDGVLENNPLDSDVKAPFSVGSEPHLPDSESEQPSVDDAITETQSSDWQQPVLPPADEGSEVAPNEAEDELKDYGDLDASDVAAEQEFNSVDSEVVKCNVNLSEEHENEVQNTKDFTAESDEVQKLQEGPVQSEGEQNQSNEVGPDDVVTARKDLDHSDTGVIHECNSEAVRCELNQSEECDVEGQNTSESTTESEDMKESQSGVLQSEEAENQSGIDSAALSVEGTVCDSTIQFDKSIAEFTAEVDCETEKVDDVLGDKVAEEIGSVNVTDKQISSKNLDSEKTTVNEEATSLLEIPAGNDTAVDEDRSDLVKAGVLENEVSGDLVNDSQTVAESGCAEGSLQSEENDVSTPADAAAGFPLSSNVDTIKEQVVDNAVSVTDTNSSADNICPQPKVENGNGESVVENKSNCIASKTLKPKISFGSFVCEAPFSGPDVSVRSEVSNRSIELNNGHSYVSKEDSKSKIKPSNINGGAILDTEANGVLCNGLNHDKACAEVKKVEHVNTDEVSSSSPEGSGAGAFKGQRTESVGRPFYYLTKIPRYDDEKLKEQMILSELQVEEKTRSRDAVRVEYQKRKGAVIQLKSVLEDAKSEERAARELVKAKRREIDASQSLVNLAKDAMTVEDVHAQILNMEHKIQHETLPLKEEKQLVRDIKQMKNLKDQLYANTHKQEQLKQALDQKDQVEERLKVLRKELASLRDNLSKADASVKLARKKYEEESNLLNELFVQFQSADTVRQDAYAHLLHLRRQWSEKNKYFRSYKDDARAANDFAMAGDKESLERQCVNQVENFMELWNKNDEFRKEYIKCNTRSTLRRLRTLDGRALGPDEEAPSLGYVSDNRVTVVAKVNSVPAVSTIKREMPVVAKNVEKNSSKKVDEQKTKTVPPKKVAEVTSKNISSAEASGRTEIEEDKEEHKPTKEEEELARKAEELRREEEAARQRELRRQEEKVKAQEALERKRKLIEKARLKAEFKAQKEAEQKEKEREKRAKKKEKKKGIITEAAESEPTIPEESPSETTREPIISEKPVPVAKKPQKPSSYAKQTKTIKSIPPPLRNRGKRRMQQWMWALATVVAILALFFLGNNNFFRNNNLLGFGPAY